MTGGFSVVQPLGLITVPNKYGQFPPGALSTAQNVCMRDAGVLGSWPGLQTLRSNAMPSGDTAIAVWPGDAYQLVVSKQGSTFTMKWVDAAGATAITVPSVLGSGTRFANGIAPIVRHRGRTLIGTSDGVLALDEENDASARLAGMPQPTIYFSSRVDPGSAILENEQAAYRAVFRRRFSDGYEITSAPSNRYVIANPEDGSIAISPSCGTTLAVALEENIPVIAGDLVELYRTKGQPVGTDPGETFYLASTTTITSNDLSTVGAVVLTDDTPDDQLGAELYTNPGQQTALKSKSPPPYARDSCVHEGHTFYFATTQPASLTAFVNGTMTQAEEGTSAADTRATHLGYREFTADVTSGSAELTNISADDMVGLSVGQDVGGPDIIANFASEDRVITAVGSTSVTLGGNATGSASAGECTARDVLTVDGYRRSILSLFHLIFSLSETGIYAASFGGDPDATSFVVTTSAPPTGLAVSGFEFSLSRQFAYEGAFTIQATNGQNYQPPIAGHDETAQTVLTDKKLNRVHWSEAEQPEAVPLLNTFFVGSGEIYRGVSVGGVILVFASDGLWQIYGDASGWAVRSLDPTLYLSGRRAVDVMDGVAYAYTNRGLVAVTANGDVRELSTPLIGGGQQYADTWDVQVICDQTHREVWSTTTAGVSFSVYNTRTGAFTTFVPTSAANAGAYSKALSSLVFATATSGGPSVEYFRADSSTTRMGSASVAFQPLVFDDPGTMKEWHQLEYAFEGFATAGTLVPTFGGTAYNARTVPASTVESRCVVAVPRNAPSYAPKLVPGFTFSAGGTSNPWSLRMVAVQYQVALQEAFAR